MCGNVSSQPLVACGSRQPTANPTTTVTTTGLSIASSSSSFTTIPATTSKTLNSGLAVCPPTAHSASPQTTACFFPSSSSSGAGIGSGKVTTAELTSIASFGFNSTANSLSLKSLASCPCDTFPLSYKNGTAIAGDAPFAVTSALPSPFTTKEISASDGGNFPLIVSDVDGISSLPKSRSECRQVPAKRSIAVHRKNLSSPMSITYPCPSMMDDSNLTPLNLSTAANLAPSTCTPDNETVNRL